MVTRLTAIPALLLWVAVCQADPELVVDPPPTDPSGPTVVICDPPFPSIIDDPFPVICDPPYPPINDDPYLVICDPPLMYTTNLDNDPPLPAPRLFSAGRTANENRVEGHLNRLVDQMRQNPSGEIPTQGLQSLIPMSGPLSSYKQQALLNGLSGEVYGSLQTLGLQIAGGSLRTVSNRIVNTDLFLNDGASLLVGQTNPAFAGQGDTIVRGQPAVSFVTGWLQGYGGSGVFSYDGNASASDYGVGGLAYGVDLGRDETGVIGLTGGNTFTSFDNDLGDSVRVNSFQIGLYGLKRSDVSYLFGVLNYGHNRFDVNRIAGGVSPVSSSFSGHQFGSYGEAGLNLEMRAVRLQPFVGMQYVGLSNSQAMESGIGGLNVAAANFNSLQSNLGARLIAHRLTDSYGHRWTPYLSARWAMELLNEQASAFSTLNGAPGASWVATGNQPARNIGMISPGLTVELTRGISLFATYEYQWGAYFRAQTGTGGLLFTF